MSVLPDRQVINQIISGHYADPFSVLGMHQTERGLQVCALLPDAQEVWLIDTKTGRRVAQLDCEDPRGFLLYNLPVVKTPSAINLLLPGKKVHKSSKIPTDLALYCRISIPGYWLKVPIYALMNA